MVTTAGGPRPHPLICLAPEGSLSADPEVVERVAADWGPLMEAAGSDPERARGPTTMSNSLRFRSKSACSLPATPADLQALKTGRAHRVECLDGVLGELDASWPYEGTVEITYQGLFEVQRMMQLYSANLAHPGISVSYGYTGGSGDEVFVARHGEIMEYLVYESGWRNTYDDGGPSHDFPLLFQYVRFDAPGELSAQDSWTWTRDLRAGETWADLGRPDWWHHRPPCNNAW